MADLCAGQAGELVRGLCRRNGTECLKQQELAGGDYDDKEERWTSVTLRRADDSERIMRPRHVVMAVGVSGIKSTPELPGLNEFAGLPRWCIQPDYADGEP